MSEAVNEAASEPHLEGVVAGRRTKDEQRSVMASMYYILCLSDSEPEEIAEQLRSAAGNIETAIRHRLVVCAVPAYDKDLEIGFSGEAATVAAAYEDMRDRAAVRPGIVVARSELEATLVRRTAPGVAVELEPEVPEVGKPEREPEREPEQESA